MAVYSGSRTEFDADTVVISLLSEELIMAAMCGLNLSIALYSLESTTMFSRTAWLLRLDSKQVE